MLSMHFMVGLLIIECCTALACALEQDWVKTIYWLGACLIQFSIIKM